MSLEASSLCFWGSARTSWGVLGDDEEYGSEGFSENE